MSEFTDYLTDVFAEFGDVRVRKMFGGYGLYREDCMFGLVADDTLYLKVDAENVGDFEALDLPPFEYNKNGKVMAMSYHQAPESILEDTGEAAQWATRAWKAARRAKSKSKPKSKPRAKSKKAGGNKKTSKKKKAGTS